MMKEQKFQNYVIGWKTRQVQMPIMRKQDKFIRLLQKIQDPTKQPNNINQLLIQRNYNYVKRRILNTEMIQQNLVGITVLPDAMKYKKIPQVDECQHQNNQKAQTKIIFLLNKRQTNSFVFRNLLFKQLLCYQTCIIKDYHHRCNSLARFV
ncbi:unnamed protein product [Paramecium sonneborni]|uniref:Uncharacterized protein n=1 Tax=Paramecium sonneborni TaxID=65129 RepID=A0A8S1N4V4_9CILI|nr:unnamed protein product [Paramecium sonneborni]